MAPAIFKNMIFATAGPLPGQFTEENLAMWSKQRKGQFVKGMDGSVTHLLCTDEQYKARSKNKRIKDAMQKGQRTRVVHYDWFEFSCSNNKKLPEKEYYFDALRAEERAKRRKQLALAQTQKNLVIGKDWINPDEFGTCHEKYVLHLFQSFAKPVLYWFGAKYYKKDDDKRWLLKAINRPSGCSRPFNVEFQKFKDFFKLKTSIHWHERITKAGTTEKTYFQYTPPTGGKPVGKGLTIGMTYEDCLEKNRQLRLKYHDLFGDALPEEAQDNTTSEDSKTQDRDQVVESNDRTANKTTEKSSMNNDVTEQNTGISKQEPLDKMHDSQLYPSVENPEGTSSGQPLTDLDDDQVQFGLEEIDSLAREAGEEERRKLNSQANSAITRATESQCQSETAVNVLLNAASPAHEDRRVLGTSQRGRVSYGADLSTAAAIESRASNVRLDGDRSNYTVYPPELITEGVKARKYRTLAKKLQPSDIVRLSKTHGRVFGLPKRKISDKAADSNVFSSQEGQESFAGADEVRVANKRFKHGHHTPEAFQSLKKTQDTDGGEINQYGSTRPLSEAQVAQIFSQPIPGAISNVAIDDDLAMDLSADDVSKMVDDMYGESKYDDGSNFMNEVHGERPWPYDHDPANPKDDPAPTNVLAEDFDTRYATARPSSARPTTAGSSGLEMDCDTDDKVGEDDSDTSMAVWGSNSAASGEDEDTPTEDLDTEMQVHVATSRENDATIRSRRSFRRTGARFEPFTDEEALFQSAGLSRPGWPKASTT